eukprot:gene9943-13376_t
MSPEFAVENNNIISENGLLQQSQEDHHTEIKEYQNHKIISDDLPPLKHSDEPSIDQHQVYPPENRNKNKVIPTPQQPIIPAILHQTRSSNSTLLSSTFGNSIRTTHLSGVYIHIPFCRRRCYYCDFPIKVIGDRASTISDEAQIYTDLIIREMYAEHELNIESNAKNMKTLSGIGNNKRDLIDTIYFGGGTPSLLPDNCIYKIVKAVHDIFEVKSTSEITLEMDPGTFTLDRIKTLRSIGINRVSMGVQSFSDDILKSCGRAHTVADIHKAIQYLHSNGGIDNFSIDLISSLPYLTLDIWEDTLKQSISSGCSHISVYDLQIEDKTAFGKWYQPGVFPLPTEEISTEMYKTAVHLLTENNNFEHYEVSNYAKLNKRSQHNQKYWSLATMHAYGLGAASYVSNERFTRPVNMKEYKNWVENLETKAINDDISNNRHSLIQNDEENSNITVGDVLNLKHDKYEYVMLALRTADGLNLSEYIRLYGEKSTCDIINCLLSFYSNRYVEFNVINIDKGTNRNLCYTSGSCQSIDQIYEDLMKQLESNIIITRARLSDPHGFLLSNDIISSVFAILSD